MQLSAEAVERRRLACLLDPDSAWIRLNYGLALLRDGQKGVGMRALSDGLALSPDEWMADLAKAEVALQADNPGEAVQLLKAAHNTNPDDGRILQMLGYAHWKLGHLEEARVCYESSLRSTIDEKDTENAAQAITMIDQAIEAAGKGANH